MIEKLFNLAPCFLPVYGNRFLIRREHEHLNKYIDWLWNAFRILIVNYLIFGALAGMIAGPIARLANAMPTGFTMYLITEPG